MPSEAVVYVIRFPNGKFYVGATSNVEKRMSAHLKADSHVGRAMRKHPWSVSVKGDGSWDECFALEVQLIKELGSKHPGGYNLTDGGEGVVGETAGVRQARSAGMQRVMSDPQRRLQAAETARKRVWTPEQRAAQSERARKQMADPERLELNRRSMKERLKNMWSDPDYRKKKSDQAKAQWDQRGSL